MIHVVQNKMSVWWRKKNTKAVKIQLYVFKKKKSQNWVAT